MALSNWASLVFDNDGKSTLNTQKFGRISIEPYKCWLYVHSPEIWKDGEAFTDDTIAQVCEGEVNLFGVKITIDSVDLVNKDGIPYGLVRLFYCESGYEETALRYGGIICNAYLDIESKIARDMGIPVGCTIGGGSNSHENGNTNILWGYDPAGVYNNGDIFEYPLPEKWQKFDPYCGVTQDMVDAFLKWEVPDKKWIENITKNGTMQWANQGDVFFSGENAKQEIGKKNDPMIHGIINKIFGKEQ